MKTIGILMAALVIFSAMPLVIAEETDLTISENVVLEDAGVTPDSPLYGLDKAMERIRLAMTFGEANKVKLKLKYAEERLAEAEEMADEDNVEAAEEAQESHDEGLAEAEELVDEIETNGDVETAEQALEDVTELKKMIESHSEKVSRIKNRILERKIAGGNWTEEQITHMRTVFEKITTKAQEMEAKMVQKRENVKTKLKVVGELSDEELEEVDAQIKAKVENKIQEKAGTSNSGDNSENSETGSQEQTQTGQQ